MLSLKSTAQSALKQLHLYERAKASRLYDLFWLIADKEIISSRDREVEFYRNLLEDFRPGDLIFDIGANQGAKTDIFLRLGARVVAVDPDESNQAILEEKFLTYRLVKKPVSLVGKAVGEKNGLETFWVDEPGSGKNTLNQKWVEILQNDRNRFGKELKFRHTTQVEVTTLETLILTYGPPFFIKIDTEGYESNVLCGLQHPVPYLSFEVNLPEFRSEGLRCVGSLNCLAPEGSFNYVINSRSEMASKRWMGSGEIIDVLKDCREHSIEVYWNSRPRNPGATAGYRVA